MAGRGSISTIARWCASRRGDGRQRAGTELRLICGRIIGWKMVAASARMADACRSVLEPRSRARLANLRAH